MLRCCVGRARSLSLCVQRLPEPPCPLQAPAKAAATGLCFFNPWGLLTQISIAGQGSIGKALEVKT